MDDSNIFVGEKYFKSIDVSSGFPVESAFLCRKILVTPELKNQNSEKNQHRSEFIKKLDQHIWRNPSLPSNQRVLQHVREFIRELLMLAYIPFPEIQLIDSGSYFSNLRVGLPYEFDFMLDITSILGNYCPLEITEPEHHLQEVPTIRKTKYYAVVGDDLFVYFNGDNISFENLQVRPSKNAYIKSGNYVNVKAVTEFFFEEIVSKVNADKWNIHDYSSIETQSPAFSISMFYEHTGILIDLVPCIRFPSTHADILPEIDDQVKSHFLRLREQSTNAQWSVDSADSQSDLFGKTLTEQAGMCSLGSNDNDVAMKDFYNIAPLYLVISRPHEDHDKVDEFKTYEFKFRLSTSSYEKFFYLNLPPDVLTAMRVLRYFFQTFPCEVEGKIGEWPGGRLEKSGFFDRLSKRLFNNKQVFGSNSKFSSYLISAIILKLLSNGQILQEWNDADLDVGQIMEELVSLIATAIDGISTDEAGVGGLELSPFLAINSWCFKEGTYAIKSITESDVTMRRLRNWFSALKYIFRRPQFDIESLPQTQIKLSKIECCACCSDTTDYMFNFSAFKSLCFVHDLMKKHIM